MTPDFTREKNWILREKYNNKPDKNFFNDVKRLKKGEPVDYIIGWKPFLNCKINLSKKPLIPRPETEYWTNQILKIIEKTSAIKIADIFAGSGCIGIAILKNTMESKVDFIEMDKKLVRQIQTNLELNKIKSSRYKIIRSDIFSNVKNKYDLILANPPYISTKRSHKIQKEVLKYEPHLALFAGESGLDIITEFLNTARFHLNKTGQIWMEFDSFQKNKIEKILKSSGYKNWGFHKDQFNRWRYIVIMY